MKIRITEPTGKAITWEHKDWEGKQNWKRGRGMLGTLVAQALDEAGKIEVELLPKV